MGKEIKREIAVDREKRKIAENVMNCWLELQQSECDGLTKRLLERKYKIMKNNYVQITKFFIFK